LKVLFRIFNVLLVLILLCILGGVLLSYLQIFSSGPEGRKVIISIEDGSTTSDIAELLARKGLVKSSTVFRLVARYTNSGDKLQAGDYTLNTGMSMLEIIGALQKSKGEARFFTIPEGYTLRQIAVVVEEKGISTKEEFLKLTEKGVPEEIDFKYSHLLEGRKLEGFLFPDTYAFSEDTTSLDVVKVMLKRFQEVVPEDFAEKAASHGLSPYKVIILASMIEREAKVKEERPLISAVYYNRMKKDMLLQCDATIQYLFEKPKELLTYDDLEIDSPYNTYLHRGLPPTPIASPGLSSIKAALEPASVNYLYYVVKGTDGAHKFSETYEEHQQAVEEYSRQINRE